MAKDGLHPSGEMYTAWAELALSGVKAVVERERNFYQMSYLFNWIAVGLVRLVR